MKLLMSAVGLYGRISRLFCYNAFGTVFIRSGLVYRFCVRLYLYFFGFCSRVAVAPCFFFMKRPSQGNICVMISSDPRSIP